MTVRWEFRSLFPPIENLESGLVERILSTWPSIFVLKRSVLLISSEDKSVTYISAVFGMAHTSRAVHVAVESTTNAMHLTIHDEWHDV